MTKSLQKKGDVQLVGIIEEQHPDRANLFMQWKQMDWPVMVDPLNLLEVSVVPIILFVDEKGVIREVNPRLQHAKKTLQQFLSFRVQEEPSNGVPEAGKNERKGADLYRRANDLVLWGGKDAIDSAIALYTRALQVEPENGALNFRLGVAYRMRYDFGGQRLSDFEKAIRYWRTALKLDPNQYIWRRRIQQYGPRLDKPYPFYDWVFQARADIQHRGEVPVPLRVEPGGAEFAHPIHHFKTDTLSDIEPDPQGKIIRDPGRLVWVQFVAVPSTKPGQNTARIYLSFTPNPERKVHWNNEAGAFQFWITPPVQWKVEKQKFIISRPGEPISREVRRIEFEISWPEEIEPASISFSAYALYYVCEDIGGTCLYRRQDIPLQLRLK